MHNFPIKKFAGYWLPVFVYAGLIFRLSAIPGSDIPGLFPYQDVVFHFLEYAVFALLLSRAIKAYWPQQKKMRRLLAVMALVLVYALSDEFHQLFVPNRTASLIDVIIDCAGGLSAGIFL
ncbi:MAG: VanZ family protein [Candidatus Omnitrophota bacterium]